MDDSSGVARWPAVPVELAFNLIALLASTLLHKRRVLAGQHFHLYLIAYGIFRFLHEFVRATPRLLGSLSGYALAALIMAGFGMVMFIKRARRTHGAVT